MLSERLRLAMDAASMSQAELARQVGVKPPSINGWLNGKAKFLRGENLLAAARALQVSQEWLATGKGSMRPAADADASLRHAPSSTLHLMGILALGYIFGLTKRPWVWPLT